ncbi:MAG: glycosyltransferase [Candidatus Taylorbacteria bacterium]|nr:glycosyltransferase [Candidatus Taylorbacteria bacterium]
MISIIIPTLNEEKVLGKTIQGLNRLTIPHEIIISDGKSTDKTREIAKQNGAKVVEYTGTKRQTISEGRNAGAVAASGEYLAFMDADCSMKDPDALFKRALKHFEDPKLMGLVPWIRVLPEYATFWDKVIFYCLNSYFAFLNNVAHIAMSGGELQMMRHSDYIRVNGYNPNLVASEDVDMLQRLAKGGRSFLDRELVVYHTGRRAHKTGWPKLLSLWVLNSIFMTFRKRAYSKEWEPIR